MDLGSLTLMALLPGGEVAGAQRGSVLCSTWLLERRGTQNEGFGAAWLGPCSGPAQALLCRDSPSVAAALLC